MNDRNRTRAKILGVLIQDARRSAARTAEQCARAVNLSSEQFAAAERGEHVLSLPELEVLAIYLGVPMAHFWGGQALSDEPEADYSALLTLRHKIVGSLLKQARLDAGREREELAQQVGIDAETLNTYELGQQEVPFLHLEELAQALGVSIDYFVDEARGPLGRHEAQQQINRNFQQLPADVRAFVAKPVNIAYLQTAMRLSEMDAEKLRNIAAGILEITY